MQIIKQQRTKAEREAHKAGWQQTGLSKVEYCNIHQLSYQTFCSWFKKPATSIQSTSQFIPVKIPSEQNELSSFATLRFSNRVTVELHKEVSAAFLKQLISCS